MSEAGDDARAAVILLDHGSREAEANAQLEALSALVAARLPGRRVACAHLSVAAPTLADAVAAVAEVRRLALRDLRRAPFARGVVDPEEGS